MPISNLISTTVSLALLFFALAGTILIAIFGKKKTGKISASGVFTGILAILTALISAVVNQVWTGVGLSIYGITYLLTLVAFIAIGIFAFARLRPAFFAIPLGFVLIRECLMFIRVLSWWLDDLNYYLSNFERIFSLAFDIPAYILGIIAVLVMFIAAFTAMKKRGLGIVAGVFASIAYFASIIYWPISDLFDMIIGGYFDLERYLRSCLWDFKYDSPFYAFAIVLFFLGITMFKTSPKADKKTECCEAPGTCGYEPIPEEAPAPVEVPAYCEAPEPEYESAPAAAMQEPAVVTESTPAQDIGAEKAQSELAIYKKMLDDGLISEADFEAKKKQILGL